MYILGLITGQFHGKNGLAPMYSGILDIILMGFIAPVGAGLLSNLYFTIHKTFINVQSQNLISSSQLPQFEKFKKKLNILYSSKFVIIAAFILGFSINVYNYFTKLDSWLGINGGITGIYGRILIGMNYFILTLFLYKCAITFWALNAIFRFDILIRPFHPDRSGGLKMIGKLAVALNYFVALILVYFTLMMIFDPFAKQHPFYMVIFILFYPFAVIMFFTSLLGAHKKMIVCKQYVFEKLGATFDFYYSKLNQPDNHGIYDTESADEISRIHNLYQMADKMPVWPFDKESIKRAFSALAIPALLFLFDLITNIDSFINNLNKLKGIFDF